MYIVSVRHGTCFFLRAFFFSVLMNRCILFVSFRFVSVCFIVNVCKCMYIFCSNPTCSFFPCILSVYRYGFYLLSFRISFIFSSHFLILCSDTSTKQHIHNKITSVGCSVHFIMSIKPPNALAEYVCVCVRLPRREFFLFFFFFFFVLGFLLFTSSRSSGLCIFLYANRQLKIKVQKKVKQQQ